MIKIAQAQRIAAVTVLALIGVAAFSPPAMAQTPATHHHAAAKHSTKQGAKHAAAKHGAFKLLSERTIQGAGKTEKVSTFRASGGIYMVRVTHPKKGAASAEAFKQTAAGTKSKWRSIPLAKLPKLPEVKNMLASVSKKPAAVAAPVAAHETAPVSSEPAARAPVMKNVPVVAAPPAIVTPPPEGDEAATETAATSAVEEAAPPPVTPVQPTVLTVTNIRTIQPSTTPSTAALKKPGEAPVDKFMTEHPRFCPGNWFGAACR